MSAPRSYSPVPIPSGLRPSPLDKGSRPLDPRFTGGRQLGKLTRRRKGAGGQGIGFRSITAAAEFSVTFGLWFYRLGARLWGRWGSSSAQGDSGRGTPQGGFISA